MTSNPLDDAVSGASYSSFATQDDIRNWCESQNSQDGHWARSVWYYAMADDRGTFTPHRVEGIDADEIRAAARGRFPEYAGWPDGAMRKHVGLVRYRLAMGMTLDSFNRLAARWPHRGADAGSNAKASADSNFMGAA